MGIAAKVVLNRMAIPSRLLKLAAPFFYLRITSLNKIYIASLRWSIGFDLYVEVIF